MSLSTYPIIPGIADLRTNADSIHGFSYGQVLPDQPLFDELASPELTIRYEVRDSIQRPETTGGKYHFFHGSRDGDVVFFDRPYFGNQTLKMVLRWGAEPTIQVNADYARVARFRINNVFPPGTILTDVLSVRLLQQQYTPLHCACLVYDGEATLIFAPPDTGKTVTSILAVRDRDFDLLAEDITLTDGTTAYTCPWTSTFEYDSALEASVGRQVRHTLSEYIPILGQFIQGSKSRITDYVPGEDIAARAPITNVVILERGDRTTERLEHDAAVTKLRNLNRYQFYYWRDPALLARGYFADGFDPQQYLSVETETIEQIVDRAETYRISTDDPTTYVASLVDLVC